MSNPLLPPLAFPSGFDEEKLMTFRKPGLLKTEQHGFLTLILSFLAAVIGASALYLFIPPQRMARSLQTGVVSVMILLGCG